MKNSQQVRILVLSQGGRIPLLTLNELGEKSGATIIFGNFVTSYNQILISLKFSENV